MRTIALWIAMGVLGFAMMFIGGFIFGGPYGMMFGMIAGIMMLIPVTQMIGVSKAKGFLPLFLNLKDNEKFIILSYRIENLGKVSDALEKSHLLREMTLEILEAGLTPGRLLRLFVLEAKIIPTIAHPRMQGIVLRFLVSKAMKAGLNSDQRELFLDKAVETALAFKDDREKNKTLNHIVKVIMEIGSSTQWLKIFPFFDIL